MVDLVDRFPLYPLLFSFVLYPVLAWAVLALGGTGIRGRVRMPLFAALNVLGLGVLCLLSGARAIRFNKALPYSRVALFFFGFYVVVVLFHFVLLRLSVRKQTVWPTLAFLFPIFFLVYIKYAADAWNPFGGLLATAGLVRFGAFFIGISYLSFRLVHLVQEVTRGVVAMPSVAEYFAFAFYVPTISIGPISPYSLFIGSIRQPDRARTPLDRSLLRIVVGWTKYIFLGSLLGQFSYAALLRDGHPHGWLDLVIAVPAYALYLYCNFSGFCDMVIGVSGLLNIHIAENFDRPFLARNLQEFWTRWHMTLSLWIRDMVFTPLSILMMRRLDSRWANDATAAALLLSFIAIGIWHGNGLNFFLFGLLQGIGLVVVHYYTIWLKRRLGRERLARYRKRKDILLLGRVVTFCYFALTLIFFANTWQQIRQLH